MMQLQATDPQDCWKLPKLEEAGATLSLHLSDFWSPELGENNYLLFKAPSLWSFVMAPPGQCLPS